MTHQKRASKEEGIDKLGPGHRDNRQPAEPVSGGARCCNNDPTETAALSIQLPRQQRVKDQFGFSNGSSVLVLCSI